MFHHTKLSQNKLLSTQIPLKFNEIVHNDFYLVEDFSIHLISIILLQKIVVNGKSYISVIILVWFGLVFLRLDTAHVMLGRLFLLYTHAWTDM